MSRPEPVTIFDCQDDEDTLRVVARGADYGERWVDIEACEDGAIVNTCLDLDGIDQLIGALRGARA